MLTKERAIELFRYERSTGKLFWIKRPTPHAHRIKAGDEVGNIVTSPSGVQYRQCSVDKEKYLVHRIVWLMEYGSFPKHGTDHEDGDGLNNRINNLRDATDAINHMNLPLRSDNRSGHIGISRHSKAPKWVAQIQHAGNNRYLGLFETKEEAIKAYRRAAKRLGFHKNHGRKSP